MFCFIGKKKWREMEEQLRATQETAADCQARLEIMQKALEDVQSSIVKQASDGAEAVLHDMRLGFEQMGTVLEGQKEVLTAQRTDGQTFCAKLFQKLDDSQAGMAQIQQKLETAAEMSSAVQKSVHEDGAQMVAKLVDYGERLLAQGEDGQKVYTKSLTELGESQEIMMGQVQQRLDAAEQSSAAVQAAVQTNGAEISSRLERYRELLEQGIEEKESYAKMLWALDKSQKAMSRLQEKLDAAGEASEAVQEVVQASGAQTRTELERIGKEISEQLMLLDESSRLLLLHTVMNELNVK